MMLGQYLHGCSQKKIDQQHSTDSEKLELEYQEGEVTGKL